MNPLTLLAAERRARADSIVVLTPRVRAAHAMFDFLRAHAASNPSGELRCGPVIAPSQTGKSTIIKSYAESANSASSETRQIPVLHVILQANSTRKQLAHDILHEISRRGFETGKHKGTEADLLDRVERYLRFAGVELLIIDEFQHVVHSDNKKVAASVADTIKRMLITGICPIVISGTEQALSPFRENHQLAHRSEAAVELSRLRLDSSEDLSLFFDFVSEYALAIEKHEIAQCASTLVEGDVPACLFELSQGVLGVSCNIIKYAITQMTTEGRGELNRSHLIRAANDTIVQPRIYSRNPLTEGFAPIRAY